MTTGTAMPIELTKAQKTEARVRLRNKLLALRKQVNCSQQEIADLIGIKHSYAALLESSRKKYDVIKAEALIRKAYTALGVDFDATPVPVAQMAFTFNQAAPSTPAEIDPEILTRLTPQEVSRRIKEFAQEFTLLPDDLARLFGVSRGHEYILRSGRSPSGIKMRRKVIQIIAKMSARWRAEAAARDTNTHTAPVRNEAPVIAAPAPMVTPPPPVIKATDTVIPAVLVKDEASLISALSFDFTTKHRLQRLPGGAILVSKEM